MVLLAAAILTELAPANGPLPVDVASRPVTIDQRVIAGDLDVWLLARLAGAPTTATRLQFRTRMVVSRLICNESSSRPRRPPVARNR